jgi:hypothetical protein
VTLVFAVAFLILALRVTVIVPQTCPLIAMALEVPVILALILALIRYPRG